MSRYVLDGSDSDLKRLVTISELLAPLTRAALSRAPIQPGSSVIECGCGPIGALPILSELVGEGRVLGLDFNPGTVDRARSAIAALGLANVEVALGDVNDLDSAALGGPFDLALTRCFLMHQADPAETLAQITAVVRPGGWIVCLEPMRRPQPRSHPENPALAEAWELMHQAAVASGVAPDAVDSLPQSVDAIGVEVIDVRGSFRVSPPEVALPVHAATLEATRERILELGVASTERIDEIAEKLATTNNGLYQWVTSPLFLEFVLRKPE